MLSLSRWRVLIDRFLPRYDVHERHKIRVAAPRDHAYHALMEVDFFRSTLVRILFGLRGLPRERAVGLSQLTDFGFVLLDEDPGTEVVYGLVGRFWQPRGGLRRVSRDEFASFSEPGYAKAAWNFRIEAVGVSGSIVSTETRVSSTDPASRRSFTRYWRLIGPFSALIRRRLLVMIRDRAEASEPT